MNLIKRAQSGTKKSTKLPCSVLFSAVYVQYNVHTHSVQLPVCVPDLLVFAAYIIIRRTAYGYVPVQIVYSVHALLYSCT